MNISKPEHLELLAPGGSFDSVKAAFMAGADAVYMGGEKFSARAYAQSVEEHSLEEAIDYAHLHDRQLYLTVNTLLKTEEVEQELYDYLAPLYERGLDGVLVQDLGALRFVRREFPELPVHASTQMTVTGPASASLLKNLGLTRVVAARELGLKELRAIYDATGMELEAFVHGAICYCYSGRCLTSSMIGGRSGNRGRCAQPCRLPYTLQDANGIPMNKKQENYLLSLKDMCTLSYLPQMVEAGVMSFKIEGRMKSPLYTAGIVSIYRKYLDRYLAKGGKNWSVAESDLYAVSQFFDRGGFTDYMETYNGRSMIALQEKTKLRKPDPVLMAATEKQYLHQELKENINGIVSILTGEHANIELSQKQVSVNVTSEECVQASINRPLSEADVKKQMNKLGNTPYQLKQLELRVSADAFMPVKQLNELRRQAVEALTQAKLDSFKRTLPESVIREDVCKTAASELQERTVMSMKQNSAIENEAPCGLYVSLTDARYLPQVLAEPSIDRIYLDVDGIAKEKLSIVIENCHKHEKTLFLRLPEILRGKATEEISFWAHSAADGLCICNLDELQAVADLHYTKPIVLEASLYVWNQEGKAKFTELAENLNLKVDSIQTPHELNEKELRKLGCDDMELMVYGYIPMMVTANCLRKTTGYCTKGKQGSNIKDPLTLTDRKHAKMPVVCHCQYCYNVIYNSLPNNLLDQTERIAELHTKAIRVSITVETEKSVDAILQAAAGCKEALLSGGKTVGRTIDTDFLHASGYTRGHFSRGVQ